MKFVLALTLIVALALQVALAADHEVLVWNLTPESVNVLFDGTQLAVPSGVGLPFVANQSAYTIVVNSTGASAVHNLTISDNSTLAIFNSTLEVLLEKRTVPGLIVAEANARFFHDVAALPDVAVYFNGELVSDNVTFGQFTPYHAVPYGTVDLVIKEANDTNVTLANTTFSVQDGDVISVSFGADIVTLIENSAAKALVKLGLFSSSPDLSVLLDGRAGVLALPNFAEFSDSVAVVAGVKHNITVLSNNTSFTSVVESMAAGGEYRVLITHTLVTVQDNAILPDAVTDARVTFVNLVNSQLNFVLNDTVHEEVFSAVVSAGAQVYVFPYARPFGPYGLSLNGTVQNGTFPASFDPNFGYTLLAYTAADGNSIEVLQYVDYRGAANQTVSFRFIHAVPDAGALDFYLNGTLHFPNVKYGGTGSVSKYVTIILNPGEDYEAVDVSVTSHGKNDSIATGAFQFVHYGNYSFALHGSLTGGVNGTQVPVGVSVLQLTDDNTFVLRAPKLRFVHLVPDYNGTVNVTISSDQVDALSNVQSLNTSVYALSTKGKKVVAVTLENGAVFSTKATLEEGSVYSIVVEGWAAAKNVSVFVVRDLQGGDFEAGLTTLELFLLIGGGILFGIMLLTIIVFAIRSRGPEGYEQLPN